LLFWAQLKPIESAGIATIALSNIPDLTSAVSVPRLAAEKIIELIYKERLQYQVFTGLSIGAMGLTGIIYFTDNQPFERFIGGLNPILTGLLIIILGGILLTYLLSQGWFAIYRKEKLKGLLRRSGLAALFVLITILLDLKIVFPADMNVLFPVSLLFYPAIGLFVEILFHVLPLSLLLMFLTSILKGISYKKIVWICILVVSLIEPIYQTIPMVSSSQYPLWAATIVLLNLYLFNLSQLLIFKQDDFISMYSFRLVYYLFWHIGWGYIRLKVLF
jgi:hypothetical protein